jgi:serine/threonine-protein kinase
MPDVIGFDLDDAEEAVLQAGLSVEVELVNSEEPAGKVVGTDPGPGERIRQGTSAVVEVSNGLSPTVQVPNLIGSTQAAANDALAQLRQSSNVDFSWVFEDVTTGDPANDGLVQAMVPGPGTVIDEQDVIVVTVWRYSP